MNYFSAFSGIGGFEKAIQDVCPKWECVGYSEIDKSALKIYQNHFPNHKNYGDIRNITELPDFDLLIGGFPCQAFSVAGKRRGFQDTRGTLFFDLMRIAQQKKPRFLLFENVKGLLSHQKGATFETMLCSLDELGYDVEWQVLNSKNFGVPQSRERVFIIGYYGGSGGRKVFPIEGNSGTALKEITLKAMQGYRVYDPTGVSSTLIGQAGGVGAKTGLYCVNDPSFIDLSMQEAKLTKQARTLQARYHKGYSYRKAETSGIAIPVLTPTREKKRQQGRRFKKNGEPAFTVTTQDKHGIFDGIRIRRLTPKECERLQGFPDGWTKNISDTQRYKCLGNAVTVNVIKIVISKIRLLAETN